MEHKKYIQHSGKVIETDGKFSHVMAVTLDPSSDYKNGVLRCITSRSGDLAFAGNVDRSELHKIKGIFPDDFTIGDKLYIKNESQIIETLTRGVGDFIGLEDPDIWIDSKNNIIHLYFTIPIRFFDEEIGEDKVEVHLGHAFGDTLDSLEMTTPALTGGLGNWAKEVSIAPLNSSGFRYNLIESSDHRVHHAYSVVRAVIAEDMGKPWKFGEIVLHPADLGYPWIGGHASPGPLFSKNFIDIGEGKLLGVMNGCEVNKKIGERIKHGNFSVGLFIYDYENGKIDWVSAQPFIQDSDAGIGQGRKITFASQFIETKNGEGILYAHVDDSFVRAYTLKAEDIKSLLPL